MGEEFPKIKVAYIGKQACFGHESLEKREYLSCKKIFSFCLIVHIDFTPLPDGGGGCR